MSNLGKSPCDEAAILSGSSGKARTTRGTWVLVADHSRFEPRIY